MDHARYRRDLAAWLGRAYGVGGKTKLLGIGERRIAYLRVQRIHGVRAAAAHFVEAVLADTGLDAGDVTDAIANLVAKSLVAFDTTRGVTHWYVLETIRAYALEKLAEHGEADAVAGRHAVYFRDLFTPPASGARSSLSAEALARGVREIDNVRAALDWSFSLHGDIATGVHLTAAYAPVWLHLSMVGECRARCDQALLAWERDPTSGARLQMELRIALGNTMIVSLGPAEQTEAVLTAALATARALHELDAQARILPSLSTVYLYHGDYDAARTTLEQLRLVAHQIGDPTIVAVADQRIGTRLLMAGRHRDAQRCFENILETPRPLEERPEFWNYFAARAMARALLSRALCLQGFPESAHREARRSVEELGPGDHPLSICRVLNFGECRIACLTGDFVAAERAIAHSIEVASRLNAPFWQVVGRFLEGKLMVERGDYAQGLAGLREAFEVCRRTAWRVSYPEFMPRSRRRILGLDSSAKRSTRWIMRWPILARNTVKRGIRRNSSASKARCCGKLRIDLSRRPKIAGIRLGSTTVSSVGRHPLGRSDWFFGGRRPVAVFHPRPPSTLEFLLGAWCKDLGYC